MMRSVFLVLISYVAWVGADSVAIAGELKTDIVFAKRGDLELKLDIALPDGDGKLRPAIICVHGGGWRGGSRQTYHKHMDAISKQGYVAVTVDYRLTQVAAWPAQIDDVQAAFKWLVDHADEYGIDRERIGVMGESAGGHLSLLLGTLPKEVEEALRIRGIVNFYGPAEMRKVEYVEHVREMVEALVGGKLEDKLDVLAAASPVSHIGRTDAPVLTLHGTKDTLVPFVQAEILHEHLKKAQIPNRLFPMEGAGHGLGGDVEGAHVALNDFCEAYLMGSRLPLVAHDDFDGDLTRWQPFDKSAWKQTSKDGRSFYSLVKKESDYMPKFRSPFNISLLTGVEVGEFVLDVDLRSTHEPYAHQDMALVFGHQDASHFYYVHFGRKADAHANSIFIVNGAPRVSIAQETTDGTDWSKGWHRARIKRTPSTGKIEIFFDDMQKPIMSTVDRTFMSGAIGVGSFDDTGDIDSLRLWGRKAD